jgi:hypothetical protein
MHDLKSHLLYEQLRKMNSFKKIYWWCYACIWLKYFLWFICMTSRIIFWTSPIQKWLSSVGWSNLHKAKEATQSFFRSLTMILILVMLSCANFEVKFIRRQVNSVAHILSRATNSWTSFHRFEIIPSCMYWTFGN